MSSATAAMRPTHRTPATTCPAAKARTAGTSTRTAKRADNHLLSAGVVTPAAGRWRGERACGAQPPPCDPATRPCRTSPSAGRLTRMPAATAAGAPPPAVLGDTRTVSACGRVRGARAGTRPGPGRAAGSGRPRSAGTGLPVSAGFSGRVLGPRGCARSSRWRHAGAGPVRAAGSRHHCAGCAVRPVLDRQQVLVPGTATAVPSCSRAAQKASSYVIWARSRDPVLGCSASRSRVQSGRS